MSANHFSYFFFDDYWGIKNSKVTYPPGFNSKQPFIINRIRYTTYDDFWGLNRTPPQSNLKEKLCLTQQQK
jgi:hypothetical protein